MFNFLLQSLLNTYLLYFVYIRLSQVKCHISQLNIPFFSFEKTILNEFIYNNYIILSSKGQIHTLSILNLAIRCSHCHFSYLGCNLFYKDQVQDGGGLTEKYRRNYYYLLFSLSFNKYRPKTDFFLQATKALIYNGAENVCIIQRAKCNFDYPLENSQQFMLVSKSKNNLE